MRYSFIDIPHFVSDVSYQKAMESMVYRLEILSGVEAVYQVGSVSSPGISDLDLVVVFGEGNYCQQNYRDILSTEKKYLFIHALYGSSRQLFVEAQRYTFFHNYKLLYGRDLIISPPVKPEEEKLLKQQIAFEFLLKMYIVMTVQRSYRIIKLRALLLEAKAIQYDLEFLGIKNGPMLELVNRVLEIRHSWFEKKLPRNTVIQWFENFFEALEKFLQENLEERNFFMPGNEPFYLAPNIRVGIGPMLSYRRKGIALSSLTAPLFGKKQFNLNHRLNEFQFFVPGRSQDIPAVISKRFELLIQMQEYNNKYLPYFLPLSSSLKMF